MTNLFAHVLGLIVTVQVGVVLYLASLPGLTAGEPAASTVATDAFPYELSIRGLDRTLRVRFRITVDGRSWRQNFNEIQRRYRQAAFIQLDADRDGTLSAEEARRLPPPRAWAGLTAGDDVHVAFNFRILDSSGDGAVSPDEFEQYAAAFGDVPVRLATVPAGRSTDDLFRALDANRDRVLTEAEWSAVGKLIERDRDGNGVLTAEELRGPMSAVMPPEFVAAPPGNRKPLRPVEFDLLPAQEGAADVEISIDYPAEGAALRRPRVDVKISTGAAALIAKSANPGHGDPVLTIGGRRLVLRIPPPAIRSGAAARQQLLNEYAAVAEQSGGEVTVTSGLAPLLKSVFGVADRNDDGRLESAELEGFLDGLFAQQSAADAARMRIVKFSERPGLMPLVDLNLDGLLSRRELQALPRQLAAVAGNEGRIAREEIPGTVVLVLQRGPFGESPEQNVLENVGPPWFFRADRNHDGDLDRDEFLGDPEDFERLDVNKDGWIDLDEAILGDVAIPPALPAGKEGAR